VKLGTPGQQQYKVFESEHEARLAHDKLVAQKVTKGRRKVSDDSVGEPQSMTKAEFWAIMDQSRHATQEPEEQREKLKDILGLLPLEKLIAFDRHFQDAKRQAYRWDLWAAAYIINGGCSDDGFEYFLCWLIAQGQAYYEAALADPNNVGINAEPGNVEFEEIGYVAFEVYRGRTGRDDFWGLQERFPLLIQGKPWDEDHVHELYPKLAKKFGYGY
jgi:hypothetical protein